MGKTLRLSQCMIVKNEETNIRKALSWGKGYVYEQIVVDTGSEDNTVSIAESMGAKVFSYPWSNDFSAAKNFAIEKASGDWIAFLDADEYYEPCDIKKVKELLIYLENHVPHRKLPHMISNSMAHLDDEGKVFAMTTQDRIFRNLPEVRYANRIHEKLVCLKGLGLIRFDATKQVTIIHTGYSKSTYKRTNKIERNINMLSKEIEKNPDDLVNLSYLGDALLTAGRKTEAEEAFRKVVFGEVENVSKDRVKTACFNVMQMIFERNNPEEDSQIKEIYKKAIQKVPAYPDVDYLLGMWLCWREDWVEAKKYLENALYKLEAYKQEGIIYLSSNLKTAYLFLTMISQKQKDYNSIVKYSVLGLRIDRNSEDLLLSLLEVLKNDSSSIENAKATCKFLKKIYNFTNLKDKLFVLKIAKIVKFSNLEKEILQLLTKEEQKWLLSR